MYAKLTQNATVTYFPSTFLTLKTPSMILLMLWFSWAVVGSLPPLFTINIGITIVTSGDSEKDGSRILMRMNNLTEQAVVRGRDGLLEALVLS